ncbi:ATP-binding protein [Pendulispora albinea]|uniref:histidine kinase n=1 Tax=Pendulispora albinea TaxID=2741071 RepID=A0ABZ2MA69_9BACT
MRSLALPATFRLLIESIQDYAIFMLDPHGIVATWNEGAHRIIGYEASMIIGQHFSRFYPPEDAGTGKWERELAEAARRGRFEEEGWRMCKNGSRFWANVILTPLRDESGQLLGFAKLVRDLTERRKNEEERRRAEKARFELEKMHEANRFRDQFLATISHELRTPLNAIVGWAELLKEREDDTIKKAVETILRNAEAQITIVNDMLDMSRIVTGKMRIDARVVDLAAILHAAVDVVRPAADAREVRLVLEGLARPWMLVGDAVRLQQMAWNLLSNAVKFTRAGGVVTVSLRRVGSSVELQIIDTGQGIESDFLPYLFEPFRQAELGPARRVGGIGLGLAIVHHIVELHGGTISGASEGKGRGATFTVTLPIGALAADQDEARKMSAAPTALPNETASLELKGARILVIDDDRDARDILQTLLRKRGASIRLATSAREGREAIDSFVPHIILCDLGMPGEDGYQFIRSVRSRPSEHGGAVPAIALTAYAYAEDARRASEAGFNYHLAKPVNNRVLLRVVHNLLDVTGWKRSPKEGPR